MDTLARERDLNVIIQLFRGVILQHARASVNSSMKVMNLKRVLIRKIKNNLQSLETDLQLVLEQCCDD